MGEPYDAETEAPMVMAPIYECGRQVGAYDRHHGLHHERCTDCCEWLVSQLRRAHDAGREAGRRERDDSLRARAEAAEAEAERLRHGLEDPRGPLEGDFVCPNELMLANLRQDLRALAKRWRRRTSAAGFKFAASELIDLLDREGT